MTQGRSSMPKIQMGVVVILFLMLSTLGCGKKQSPPEAVGSADLIQVEAAEGSSLVMEPRLIDLGALPIGTEKRFTADLVNNGEKAVELTGFESTCAYANVRLAKQVCAVGERVQVEGFIRAGIQPGKFRQQVRIRIKNETSRLPTLDMIGIIEACLPLSRETVVLAPEFFERKSAVDTLVIYNKGDSTVTLQEPVGLLPGIEAKLDRQQLKPGDQAELMVRARPEFLTEGSFEMRVNTSHPLEGVIRIRVLVKPEKGLKVLPGSLRLGVVKKEELIKQRCTISLVGESLTRCRIEAVHPPPFLRFVKKEAGDPGNVDLVFALVESFSGVDLTGAISIDLRVQDIMGTSTRSYTVYVPVSGVLNEG
jgi:hypothetical protein